MYREAYSCDDILLVPRYSELPSRNCCSPEIGEYSLPVISSPMDMVYSKDIDALLTSKKIMTSVHRYFKDYKEQLKASASKKSSDYRFFAVGSLQGKGKAWIDGLLKEGIKHFLVDMAHGDSKSCVDTVRYLKESIGNNGKIIAGNVATKSGFRRLEEAGAWAIRVGIGSGSICSTRLNTGFGVPLLVSVEDCALVRDKALIIADGGIKYPGDIAKAIAFGADLVMLGRMFASTSLAPGDCYDKNGHITCTAEEFNHSDIDESRISSTVLKRYRGMASAEARKGVLKKASVEGVSGLIPYTGTTEDFIDGLEANLKASLSYAGAENWKQFRTRVKKIKVSNAAIVESQTHVRKQ
jgi:IMP dehydrogenase